jgi:alkaline phosphatase
MVAYKTNGGARDRHPPIDETVGVAVEFARRHPGTLIVVQGDPETGGLTIENPDDADESGDGLSKGDRRPHRRRHADHGERPGVAAVRRRDRQHLPRDARG